MNRMLLNVTLCLAFGLIAPCVLATEYPQSPSLGGVAMNLLGPVGAVISMVRAVCIITGIGLFMGSLVKFSDHRKNPIPNPLSTVIVMLIAGITLILLAFVPFLNA